MKYNAGKKQKDERQTMRVRDRVYDYVLHEAETAFRTPPAEVELFAELHKVEAAERCQRGDDQDGRGSLARRPGEWLF